jgi:hypothetical protein
MHRTPGSKDLSEGDELDSQAVIVLRKQACLIFTERVVDQDIGERPRLAQPTLIVAKDSELHRLPSRPGSNSQSEDAKSEGGKPAGIAAAEVLFAATLGGVLWLFNRWKNGDHRHSKHEQEDLLERKKGIKKQRREVRNWTINEY